MEMHKAVQPLVSVLIPAYNRPHYLELALRSVLKQTYPNIEIIVSDDSTNSDVKTMITPYLRRYEQIKYSENKHRRNNFERCLELSSGEYINYLMDDDLFSETKIEKMMGCFLNHKDLTLVTSSKRIINAEGKLIIRFPSGELFFNEDFIIEGKLLGDQALKRCLNVIGEPTTVLFKKEYLEGPFGLYRGRIYTYLNDLATWIHIMSKGKAAFIKEELSSFRVHSGQNQKKPEFMILAIKEWFRLLKNSRKDGFLSKDEDYTQALRSYMSVYSTMSSQIKKLKGSKLLEANNVKKYLRKCKKEMGS